MLSIAFIGQNRKVLSFLIEGKQVTYYDEIWKDGMQVYPKDQNAIRKLIRSGKQDLKVLAALMMDANRGENLKQYQACKTEEDIANILRKDCIEKGLMEV